MKQITSVDVQASKRSDATRILTWARVWVYRRDEKENLSCKEYDIRSQERLERARKMQNAIISQ